MSMRHVRELTRKLQAVAPSGHYIEAQEIEGDTAPMWRRYTMWRKRDEKASASMTVQTLPGCCGVVLFYNLTQYQPKGDIVSLIEAGRVAAQKAGYGFAVLTLHSTSPLVKQLTEEKGWGKSGVFRNGKTDREITMLGTVLPQVARTAVLSVTEGE